MIEIIRDMQTFLSLSDQWNKLADFYKSPLMRHEWFASCLTAFYQKSQMHIVAVYENNEITAVAPLVCVHRQGIHWLELIGVSSLGEPCGILFKNIKSLRKLTTALIKMKKPFVLSRIPSNLSIVENIKQLSKSRGLFFHRQTAPSSAIECKSPWEIFYASVSPQRRYDHRRARRKTDKFGLVTFQTYHPSAKDYRIILNKAFKVESASWKKKKGTAILVNDKLRSFFLSYGEWTARHNSLRIFFMHIDDNPAAMQICLEYANKLWVLKIGYNEKWAACSPGIQLMNFTIKYAFERGLNSYEFLGSNESWLQVWANKNQKYSTIVYYPFTPVGILGFGTDILTFAKKKMKNKLHNFIR